MNSIALKFDLNLQRLASIVAAINFWELPDIKTRITGYFSKYNCRKTCCLDAIRYHQVAWNKIIDEVIHYVQLIIKPKKIQREIIYFVPLIGEKILDFTKFVILHDLQFNAGNLQKIHFTPVGTTNDIKIFRFYCETNLELKLNAVVLLGDTSSFAFQNLITSSERNGSYFPIEFGKNCQMFFIYAKVAPPEGRRWPDWQTDCRHCNGYKMQKRVQIILRLLNEMSEEDTVKLFICTYFYELITMCLTTWPYQELIFQMLDVIAEVENIDHYYRQLYRLILSDIRDCHRFRNFSKQSILYEVLEKLLEVMPVKIKRESASENQEYLRWCFRKYYFAPLALVLSDKDLIDQKSKLIDVTGIPVLEKLIKKCDFKQVYNFLDAGILSEEEKKAFKNKYTPLLKKFAKMRDFAEADKLLDWMSGSFEERVQIKRQIDSVEICQEYSKKNDLDLSVIDSILIWQFDSDKEGIKKIKTTLMSTELFPNEFCKIWNKYCHVSLSTTKKECTEFLRWFLDPGDVDKFKREKLIRDETFVRLFCDLICPRDFGTIDDLFKFCRIPTKKIENIKREFRDNMNWWIKLYALEKGDFKRAYALVYWISKNKNEKREIIKNFVNSPDGVECYSKILKMSRPSGDVINFLNHWLKPYGDIKTVKENLVHSDESFEFRNNATFVAK